MASAAADAAPSVVSNSGVVISQQQRALADMRAFLARARPASPSDALRLLRNAYPEAPLSLRVAACGISEG